MSFASFFNVFIILLSSRQYFYVHSLIVSTTPYTSKSTSAQTTFGRLLVEEEIQTQREQQRRLTVKLFAGKNKKKKGKGDSNGPVFVNRQARRNYEIIETMEAGISLLGTEVKSIRDGKMNLKEGFVKPEKNGRSCTLHNVHIAKHTMSSEYFNHEETRPRPLLLHKRQSLKLLQQTEQQGMTVVPLKAYFNKDNKLKIEIALCKGKNVRDKRATIKERENKREENRIMKSFKIQ